MKTLCSLLIVEKVPRGGLAIYDKDMEWSTLCNNMDGNVRWYKTKIDRIILELQEQQITERQMIDALKMAARHTSNTITADKVINPDKTFVEHRKYEGMVMTRVVSGQDVEKLFGLDNYYVKGFVYTILLPDPEFLGVIAEVETNDEENSKFGMFLITDNIMVVK